MCKVGNKIFFIYCVFVKFWLRGHNFKMEINIYDSEEKIPYKVRNKTFKFNLVLFSVKYRNKTLPSRNQIMWLILRTWAPIKLQGQRWQWQTNVNDRAMNSLRARTAHRRTVASHGGILLVRHLLWVKHEYAVFSSVDLQICLIIIPCSDETVDVD